MNYQLWDLDGGNLIGVYDSEAEALSWVHRYLVDAGVEYVLDLALESYCDGKTVKVAAAKDLVHQVQLQAGRAQPGADIPAHTPGVPLRGRANQIVFTPQAEIDEESRRVRRLRIVVNLSLMLIAQGDLAYDEAQRLVTSARDLAESLFPGKGDVYDLIYRPQFRRLINEVYRLQ